VPQAVPGDWLLTSVSALPLSAEAARNDIAMARWPKVYEAALWTDDANTKPSSTSRIIRVSIVALIDTPLTGDPRDAAEPLLHDQPGYSTVNWSTDEAVLTLAGRNVTSSELAAVGADLTVDGTEVAGTPPAGFHDALPPTTLSPTSPLTFGVGLTSYGAGMINDQTTGYLTKFVTAVDRGLTDVGSTSVTRTSADRLWLAYLSSPQPVQTTELDGAPAFSIATTCADLLAAGSTNPNCTSNDESYTIFWWREPTVLVSVSAYNEADARSVAASLTPVDHDTWDDYVSSAQTPIAGTPGE
jgi:hypothetical protein